MTTDVIRYERSDHKAYITMDRPDSLNAFNSELRKGLKQAFDDAARDDQVLVVILTGEGGRAFSVGADLKEMAGRADSGHEVVPPRLLAGGVLGVPRHGQGDFFDAIDSCPKPVIAAVDGYCLAAGLECALLCDVRVATKASEFGLPEPRRGLLAGPGLVNLSRVIPLGEALRYQLTGSRMSAARAYTIGLIQEIADDRAALMAVADGIANEILECSPLAVQYIKQVVKVGRNLPIEYAWKYSELFWSWVRESDDFREGPRAFAEKRKPHWRLR